MRLKGNRLWIYPLPSSSSYDYSATSASSGSRRESGSSNNNENSNAAHSPATTSNSLSYRCSNKSRSSHVRTSDKRNDNKATNDDDGNQPSTTIGMLNTLIQNLTVMSNVTIIQQIDVSGIEISQLLADYIIRLLQFGTVERLALLLCPCDDPNRIRRIITTALHCNLKQLEWQETSNMMTSSPSAAFLPPKNTSQKFGIIDSQDDDNTPCQQHQHLSTVRLNIRMPSHHHHHHRRARQKQLSQEDGYYSSTSWFLNDLFTAPPTLAPARSCPTTTVLTIQHLFLNGSCLHPPALIALGSWLRQQQQQCNNVLETLSLKWCRLDDNDVASLVSNFFTKTHEEALVAEKALAQDKQDMLQPIKTVTTSDSFGGLKVLDVAGNRCSNKSMTAISHLISSPMNALHTLDVSNQSLYDQTSPKKGILKRSPFPLEQQQEVETRSNAANHMSPNCELDERIKHHQRKLPLDELSKALQSPHCQLRKLRLSGNELTDKCLAPLLDLGIQNLRSGAMKVAPATIQESNDLTRKMKSNLSLNARFCSHTLNSLDLSANLLTDDGISNLVRALLMQQRQHHNAPTAALATHCCSALQELNVKANPFQAVGMARLLYLMQTHNEIASLSVEQCKWSFLIRHLAQDEQVDIGKQRDRLLSPRPPLQQLPQLPNPKDTVCNMTTMPRKRRNINEYDGVSIFPPPEQSLLSSSLTVEWIQQEIQYHSYLNQSGRKLLAWPIRNQIPITLWPHILAKINRRYHCSREKTTTSSNNGKIGAAGTTSLAEFGFVSTCCRNRRCRARGTDDCCKTMGATILYHFIRHGPALLENQFLSSTRL